MSLEKYLILVEEKAQRCTHVRSCSGRVSSRSIADLTVRRAVGWKCEWKRDGKHQEIDGRAAETTKQQ